MFIDEREYTIACIGGDSVWNDYLVFVVVNKYDNLYNGENYILIFPNHVSNNSKIKF